MKFFARIEKLFALLLPAALFCLAGCSKTQMPSAAERRQQSGQPVSAASPEIGVSKIENPGRVIHVLVALCDNENQGIVPVPASLGNGEYAVPRRSSASWNIRLPFIKF